MLKPASLLRGDRLPLTLSSLILVLGIVVLTARMPLLYDIQQRLEWFAYDLRMRLNLPNETEFDPQVVIVDIDEKSLAAEGQWPWSRRRIADLVEAISGAGAMVVASVRSRAPLVAVSVKVSAMVNEPVPVRRRALMV